MAKPDTQFSQPEVIPPGQPLGQPSAQTPAQPRLGKQAHWFDDENLDLIARVLDDWLRVPGTSIRFGLDGIIGLVPGLGDIVGGLASLILLVAAWVRGVPYVGLVRMVANIAISVLVGAVPILGDAFDIAWKANRRNYQLLTRHIAQPAKHTWKDWAFLLTLAAALVAVFCTPLVLLVVLLAWMRRHFVL